MCGYSDGMTANPSGRRDHVPPVPTPRPVGRPVPIQRLSTPATPDRVAPVEPGPLLRRVIGTVLRRIRLAQGRTLRDVARAAGVSLPYLSELERGRKEPSSEVLGSVCRALGVRLTDLLEQVREELFRLESEACLPGQRRRSASRTHPYAQGSYRGSAPAVEPRRPGASRPDRPSCRAVRRTVRLSHAAAPGVRLNHDALPTLRLTHDATSTAGLSHPVAATVWLTTV